ncbi:hypothetical protein SAMN05518668_108186 [Sphingobium sp. YR657]|uniref:Uncharacterized protein n=2 Tax=Sphingomonadaceae TaxID=41297 RepID=K9D4X9_SPHYA|nr:hypothetical protein HMPREF9718_03326 [Sphingobium yanoikuyae ATCC 51230]SHM37144.1 hypothetical protein SAMN05518668_108186 [Sphingobium sp. YR657]
MGSGLAACKAKLCNSGHALTLRPKLTCGCSYAHMNETNEKRHRKVASLVAPIVAGPAFCFSIVVFLLLLMVLAGKGGATGEAGAFVFSAGLFMGLTLSVPVGYVISVAFTFPCAAFLDERASVDARWARLGRWIAVGSIGGALFGIFLILLIRPGNSAKEAFLLVPVIIIGNIAAGAATAWLRHAIIHHGSGRKRII